MVNDKKKRNRLLDLDALNPSIGNVKVGGKKYEVFQPGYEDFIIMPILFNKLGGVFDVNDEALTEEKMGEIKQMRKIVQRMIPKLDQSILTFPQLMSVVDFVSEKFADQMEDQYGTTEDDTGK